MDIKYPRCQEPEARNVRIICLFVFLIYLLLVVTGCATHSRTTRTTTTDTPVEATTTTTTSQVTSEPSRQTTVVTEDKTRTAQDGGILGGAFHVVGEVLAFPFRVVAAVLDAIF